LETEKLTITVNGRRERLFRGLKVRHAIGNRAAKKVEAHRALVYDQDNNLVDLDGALYEGEALTVVPVTEEQWIRRKVFLE